MNATSQALPTIPRLARSLLKTTRKGTSRFQKKKLCILDVEQRRGKRTPCRLNISKYLRDI